MSIEKTKKCPTCSGLGTCPDGSACPDCNGAGELPYHAEAESLPCWPLPAEA